MYKVDNYNRTDGYIYIHYLICVFVGLAVHLLSEFRVLVNLQSTCIYDCYVPD